VPPVPAVFPDPAPPAVVPPVVVPPAVVVAVESMAVPLGVVGVGDGASVGDSAFRAIVADLVGDGFADVGGLTTLRAWVAGVDGLCRTEVAAAKPSSPKVM
jgi:hypothetical protein